MRKPIVVIWILVTALFASNALWAYWAVDTGITATYRDQSWQDHHEALTEALAIAPVAARTDSTPHQ